MGSVRRCLSGLSVILLVMASGCSTPAPASPTAAAKPPSAASPAAAAAPASSPAASPVASPAPQPASSPAAAPAAKPSAQIDPSLASVWEGKTLTVIVSQPPGGGTDST